MASADEQVAASARDGADEEVRCAPENDDGAGRGDGRIYCSCGNGSAISDQIVASGRTSGGREQGARHRGARAAYPSRAVPDVHRGPAGEIPVAATTRDAPPRCSTRCRRLHQHLVVTCLRYVTYLFTFPQICGKSPPFGYVPEVSPEYPPHPRAAPHLTTSERPRGAHVGGASRVEGGCPDGCYLRGNRGARTR